MGGCCCKEEADVAIPVAPSEVSLGAVPEFPIRVPKNVDPRIVDQLVLEMLKVAASRVDTDEESPVSLVKLHAIADKEEGWIQMLTSMVNVIPLEDPFGPTAISILLDDCPLPSKESVIKVESCKLNLTHFPVSYRAEIVHTGSVSMTMHVYDKHDLMLLPGLAPDERTPQWLTVVIWVEQCFVRQGAEIVHTGSVSMTMHVYDKHDLMLLPGLAPDERTPQWLTVVIWFEQCFVRQGAEIVHTGSVSMTMHVYDKHDLMLWPGLAPDERTPQWLTVVIWFEQCFVRQGAEIVHTGSVSMTMHVYDKHDLMLLPGLAPDERTPQWLTVVIWFEQCFVRQGAEIVRTGSVSMTMHVYDKHDLMLLPGLAPDKKTHQRLTVVTHLFRLSHERATVRIPNIQTERNICVILGCIAEKLVGPNSVAILTDNTLEYLFAFLTTNQEPCIVLFALIALIKFAHTTENKLTIKSCLEKYNEHPLLHLEKFNRSGDFVWRQVGFCANWAMDNLFTVEGRTLSYLLEDMSRINALLNSHDVSEYLQISSNGLEARCDSYSFESVRCTFQIDRGCWYYEATIVTSGVMQIGWATKNSHFLNDEGYGIGDDIYSISYDGCRKLVWYNAKPTYVMLVPAWKPGDVLGCLIDLEAKEVVFSLNGLSLTPCREIFDTTRYGFFAAASFMAYQQCLFNFGLEVFKFPPTDRKFSSFNENGKLTDEEKKVIPRRIYLEQLRCSSVKEDSCQVCYDETACCVLEPCQHGGFCSVCTSMIKYCPLCRAEIYNIKRVDT